jgi:hypothetical protein
MIDVFWPIGSLPMVGACGGFECSCPSPAILYNPFGWLDRQVGPPKWGI